MFEPDPVNVAMLSCTLRRVAPGISLLPFVVSDAEEPGVFALDAVSAAADTLKSPDGSFVTCQYHVRRPVTRVHTISLDKVRVDSPRVDLIKIDVEGHEEAVVRGALRTLADDRPVLIFELSRSNSAIVDTLRSLGYILVNAERMVEGTTVRATSWAYRKNVPSTLGRSGNAGGGNSRHLLGTMISPIVEVA